MSNTVLCIENTTIKNIEDLLGKYELRLQIVEQDNEIPGSFWGDSEAGLIANTLYVRPDTPIHSLLHETCHYICMDEQRRKYLDTNAEGDYDEENAVCYLQILLANEIVDMGSTRMMLDMDSWGYTFRLGSAQNWFEKDADGAKQWLLNHLLIDKCENPTYKLRIN